MWVVDAVCQLEDNFLPAVDFENNRKRVVLPEVNREGNKASATRLALNYSRNGSQIFHFLCLIAGNGSVSRKFSTPIGFSIKFSCRLADKLASLGSTQWKRFSFVRCLSGLHPLARASIHLGPSFDWVIYSEEIGLKLRRMGEALNIESSSVICLLSEMSFRNFLLENLKGWWKKWKIHKQQALPGCRDDTILSRCDGRDNHRRYWISGD